MHFRVSRIPVLAAVLVLLMTAYLVWQTEEFEDALAHATLDVGGQIAIPSSKDVLQGEMINGGDNFKGERDRQPHLGQVRCKSTESTSALLADRFKSDEHYLLSGHIAGWNNQGLSPPLSYLRPRLTSPPPLPVISYANTVHLALLSSRVPILPAFLGHPSQLGGSSLVTDPDPRLAFSAIFDLPRLVSALQAKHPGFRGIVDYTEVVEIGHWPAPPNGQQIETSSMVPEDGWWELGCWKCFIDRLDFTYERYHISEPPALISVVVAAVTRALAHHVLISPAPQSPSSLTSLQLSFPRLFTPNSTSSLRTSTQNRTSSTSTSPCSLTTTPLLVRCRTPTWPASTIVSLSPLSCRLALPLTIPPSVFCRLITRRLVTFRMERSIWLRGRSLVYRRPRDEMVGGPRA
jgi:hypothetical protein